MSKALTAISTILTVSATLSTPASAAWVFMGSASTGEGVSVDADSIGANYDFRYQIGSDIVHASANCQDNQWYAQGYGWYSPQSQATQNMLNYVCSYGYAAQEDNNNQTTSGYCDTYQVGSTWDYICNPNSVWRDQLRDAFPQPNL